MALISLKCPQCGGEIQLDNIREIGFCMYCGSKVAVQEAIKRQVVVDESHKIEGWIALGYDTLRSRNYIDAEQYANKIIELDSKSPDAWYIRGCCATKEQIAIENWNKALSNSKNDQPVWQLANSALANPINHFQTRMRTINVVRGSSLTGSARTLYIYINDKERIQVSNGQSRSFMVEEGSYVLKGKLASFSQVMPLDIKKDMTVCVNYNKRENKWDMIAN